ncbi:MAG: hypothetical protein ACOYOA_05990 [Saprospiraceae bacterium]
MKASYIFATFLLLTQTVCAQQSGIRKIPDLVSATFKNAHPTIQKASWEREKSNFEVDFKNAQGKKMSLLISPEGKIIETEIEIDFNELPKAAQNALKGKQTKEICRITDFKGKITAQINFMGRSLSLHQKR